MKNKQKNVNYLLAFMAKNKNVIAEGSIIKKTLVVIELGQGWVSDGTFLLFTL